MADKEKERIILGIDPGTTTTGYGIISTKGNRVSLVTLGIIRSGRNDDHYIKIKKIFEKTLGLIDNYLICELAIESPFYGKNIQSMLKLGRAQGAAIAAALHRSVPVFEYAPKKIKLSVTGSGTASKEQVAGMLMHILDFHEEKVLLDATDALGAALCHFYQSGLPHSTGGSKSWKDYVEKNPQRIRGSKN